VRVAWVSHHLPYAGEREGHFLPGEFIGGAEMTDHDWISASPVNLTIHSPGDWTEIDADHFIVTGTDYLTEQQMTWLGTKSPVVFVHHTQPRSPGRKALIDGSSLFLVHTPAHLARELEWTSPKRTDFVLSPMDTLGIAPARKQRFAVWAQRMHFLKGPLAAKVWAASQDLPLTMLSDAPRAEVLSTMARASHYVHLPLILESESRATMEAVLSGCKVHVNDNVGIASVEGWDDRARLAGMLDGAAERFWDLALS
jgi:hypothetical protein